MLIKCHGRSFGEWRNFEHTHSVERKSLVATTRAHTHDCIYLWQIKLCRFGFQCGKTMLHRQMSLMSFLSPCDAFVRVWERICRKLFIIRKERLRWMNDSSWIWCRISMKINCVSIANGVSSANACLWMAAEKLPEMHRTHQNNKQTKLN